MKDIKKMKFMLLIFAVIIFVSTNFAFSVENKSTEKELMELAFDTETADTNSQQQTIAQKPERPAKKPVKRFDPLALWNDPDFQKQFTESYIAETEIEPGVKTEDQREQMQEIFELISSDQMEQAAQLLRKNNNEAASAVFDFTLANIYFQQSDEEGLTDQQRKQKLQLAADSYQKAVEKYPKFRRAWKNLSLIYIRDADFQKAIPALTKVIQLGGGDATTYGLLGYAYASVDNSLSAETAYRMAILLDPQTLDWKMGLARSFFKQQRYAESVAITNQLIADHPEKADLWMLQANAYIGLEKPLKAAEIFELVDQLGQSTQDSLNMLGDIYVNDELYELAVEKYIQAIEMNPQGKPDRAIRSAKVLIARGALKETKKIIENIQKIYGDNVPTEDKKDLLKIKARIAVADGSGEEEATVLKEIVELDPLDGEALILLGQYEARHGKNEQAINYFERAAAIEKFEADAKVRHAQLLVKNGKYQEALPLLRRAQMINPRENIQKYLEQVERVAK